MSRRLAALLATAALVPLAGCGDSGSSGGATSGADPAKAVPADAAAYVEAVLRPDGDVKDGALDALKKILKTDDPGGKISSLLDKALAKEGTSWEKVKEWLGPRAGGFISGVESGKPIAAVIFDITDKDKAADAIKGARKTPTTKSTYKGVEINTSTKSSYALLDDYAIVGTTTGVKQAIDTTQGRQPLSDVADYTSMRSTLQADDALGIAYAQPQRILDILKQALPDVAASGAPGTSQFANPQVLQVLRQAIGQLGRAAGVALQANGDRLRLDGAGLGNRVPANPAAADAVAGLPDDAWLALGFGDIGKSLTKVINQFKSFSQMSAGAAGAGVPNVTGVLGAFNSKSGINIQRDLLSWMGSGAVYARGSGLMDIGAVLTVKSKNPAKSVRAVDLIGQYLTKSGRPAAPAQVEGYTKAIKVRLSDSVPIALYIAANGERFSAGINPEALTAVLAPQTTFGDSELFKNASDILGEGLRPVFVLDFQKVVTLLGQFLSTNPGFAKVKPYLDTFGTVAVGTAHDGDVSRFALAVGLR